MAYSRSSRQRAIAHILRSHRVSSQEELAERLSEASFSVTQATISRDLEELGAVKIRRNGSVAYAMPEELNQSTWAGQRLPAILQEWARSIEAAGNLIVIKTPPGSAHLVGVAIDQAQLAEIVGTICGDDTIFLALRDSADANSLATRLRRLDPSH